jgi:hypothetical protein
MNLIFVRSILTFFILLSLVSRSRAATSSALDDEETVSEFEEGLVETDKVVSDWFNSVTEGVDLFLVGKKIVKKPKAKSEIVLTNTTYSRESNNLSNLTSISVNPRLPNLEAYWNLKFSTYDDTAIGNRSQGGYARQTPQDKKYAATIGLFRKLKNVRVSFQPRIEIQDPLKVSHFLTAETVADYGTYQLNPKFQLFADATVGTGCFQALNLNVPLNDKFSFAMLNEGEYQERIHRFSVTNGFSLGQVLDETKALSYGINFYSNNQTEYHLDAYSLSTTWTQILIKKILDYQLTPHLDFVRDENFRGFVGLIFELNFRF